MTRNNKKPWERLQTETSRQFQAFCIYRDMSHRSIGEVAKVWSDSGATSRLNEWSRNQQWVERALAYDEHLDEIRRGRQEQEIVEMVVRHVRIARNFQDKINKRLLSIDPNDLSPQDLARWYDTSVKIERISLEVPTENIRQEQEIKEVKDESTTEALKNPETRKIANKLIKQLADSKTSTNRTGMDSN